MTAQLRQVEHANTMATALLGNTLPTELRECLQLYVRSRDDQGRRPPAMWLELTGHAVFVTVLAAPAAPGEPALEVVVLREEVQRDAEAFRLLNERYGVTRREYQIVVGLRLGKTNRQMAAEYGLAPGTVSRHVHRLLGRFGAPNRTRLVNMIDEILRRKG